MMPLNDEWLSWPPESLEGFFQITAGHLEIYEAVKQPMQEQDNEDIQTNIIR